MGVIISPEAIREGRVPEAGAHYLAARFMLDELFEPQEYWTDHEQGVFSVDVTGASSGLVYGSVARGIAGPRSDIDVLVNYHAVHADKALPTIRDVFDRTETRFNVPIEANVLDIGALFDPLQHTVDPLLAKQLLAIQRQDEPRWSYGWPVHALSSQTEALRDPDRLLSIAVRYASAKVRQFARAQVSYRGQPDLKVLQRGLELPGAIPRKVVPAIYENADWPELTDRDDVIELSNSTLEQQAPDYGQAVVKKQRQLIGLDRAYDQLLEATINGNVDVSSYQKWINMHYLRVCATALAVADAWREIAVHRLQVRQFQRTSDSDQLDFFSYDPDQLTLIEDDEIY